ncbi:hypothetical protein JCM3775_006865 [Rhodotorula graminis]|uniref:BZIP domain-containing protein n=1 Tax=Rhodotorula graminis (strain WP1) TaxID=578459 RepID=A0A194SB29_RHOGW|nr:uncharacterized protein RHOBADRAFT_51608 [Rhodotorula graminis WP1]KPV77799.1 hypothetical protein RHOBADRAFT_51608 [Rhodotorula graminis WP1]
MAAGDPDYSQLSALVSSFQQQQQQPDQQLDPLVVDPQDPTTAGMSFHELFSHYLAPEVAKLPQSSAAPVAADPLAFTFGDDQSSTNAVAGPSSASTFDPSTFMPTIPGSPIGGFSPSSDGNSSHRSPMSFPDLDFSATSDPFALDPSIFGVSAGLDYGMPVDAVDTSFTFTPATSTASDTPLSVLPNAPLPPLPNLYLDTTTTSAPTEVPAAAVAGAAELTASGRPKRNVAHSVLDADEDDDDAMYSSDASNATTTRKASARGSSRKPSAAKKARASSSGASEAGAAHHASASASTSASAAAAAAEAKRLARTSVVPLASSDLHKTTANSKLPPVPQWADKPDPDEYQKLSSKEKRQMRNKISARNFRHRRKEYITTLEEEISSRDTIISELRDEVGVIRAENSGLRTEVATLKEKWQDLLDKLSSLSGTPVASPAGTAAAGLGTNPPRAVAAAVAGSSSAASLAAVKEEEGETGSLSAQPASASSRRIGTRSGGVARPNLTKDVSALGRRGATGSWATAGGFGGGFTSVHTTLLPDVNLADGLHGKPSLPPFATQSFNPALNALTARQLADLPAMTAHLRNAGLSSGGNNQQPQQSQQAPKGTFEDFFASNPYWLRPDQLDQSRAALYGKLANNAAGLVAAQAKSSQQDGFLPVPAGFAPSFFRSSTSPSAASSAASSDLTASTSAAAPTKSSTAAELLAFQSPATAFALGVSHQDATLGAAAAEQHAALMTAARVATLARETLASRMWSAFVDAFAGPAVGPGAAAAAEQQQRGAISADKVAAVLGGRARVEVVPVVAAPAPVQQQEVDALGERMGGMSLARAASPVGGSGADERECGFEGVVGRWLSGGAAPKRA